MSFTACFPGVVVELDIVGRTWKTLYRMEPEYPGRMETFARSACGTASIVATTAGDLFWAPDGGILGTSLDVYMEHPVAVLPSRLGQWCVAVDRGGLTMVAFDWTAGTLAPQASRRAITGAHWPRDHQPSVNGAVRSWISAATMMPDEARIIVFDADICVVDIASGSLVVVVSASCGPETLFNGWCLATLFHDGLWTDTADVIKRHCTTLLHVWMGSTWCTRGVDGDILVGRPDGIHVLRHCVKNAPPVDMLLDIPASRLPAVSIGPLLSILVAGATYLTDAVMETLLNAAFAALYAGLATDAVIAELALMSGKGDMTIAPGK